MNCGTYQGARRHRRHGEALCQPCRDAQNVYRRELWAKNPEVGRKHAVKYKAKFAPIKEAKRAAKKAAREAAAAERAEKLAVARAERAALKEVRRIEREAELAKVKANKAKVKAKVNAEKFNDALRAIRYQRKLIASQLAKHERRQALEARKEQARLIREVAVAAEQLKRQQREQKRLELASQHGTDINDYYRCKKNNTTACEACLKAAAAYRRVQVAKDPAKFNQQKKRSLKANPHRRPHNNRERARKKGVPSQYYTRQQLFDRDGYDCYLCNLPVELTANHVVGQPGWELYPHVDHVIPLALGGHDTLSNVKITHAKCNMAKGATAPSF
jgi:5-methylcytosine-specific restriction endonuclease McrA